MTEAETIKAYKATIEALDRRIPKKPIKFYHGNGVSSFGCPVCRSTVGKIVTEYGVTDRNQRYCHRCGQKLDWGESE